LFVLHYSARTTGSPRPVLKHNFVPAIAKPDLS
jgi:hypothetical protein